jgi:hypothetical protein
MEINMSQKILHTLIRSVMLVFLVSLSVHAETEDTPQVNLAVGAHDSKVANKAAESMKVNVDENSFQCIRKMSPVRHFYVDNLLGDIQSTMAAANAPEGAKYPVGSVVQLVPTEAMVKREKGTFPATGDWEFFELEVNEEGSTIGKRGFVDVVNRFGGNCFSCHAPAREPWDFICESGHGCDTIPIDHKMTGALQRSDPRCEDAVPEDGDWMALFKLKSMVSIGLTKKWFEDTF